jgi:hypothetical protein
MEPFRQYYKAGGTPGETIAAMGSPIGEDIRQQYSVHRMGELMQGGDFSKNLMTAAGEGLIPWPAVLSYMKQPAKAPALMPEDMQGNIRDWLASNPNIDPQTRAYAESALAPGASYGTIKAVNDKVIPPYQGSTLFATRGFNMIGNDGAGRPIITRFVEGTRGGPAHVQTLYPDSGEPVPPEAMKGAKYLNAYPDAGGGAGGGPMGMPAAGEGYGVGYGAGAPPTGGLGAAPPGAPPAGPPPAPGGPSSIPAPLAPSPAGAPGKPLQMLHLGGNEVKTVANIQSLLPQLRGLQNDMNTIGQDKWNRNIPTRIFSKYLAQKLDILPGTDAKVAGPNAANDFMANDKDFQQLQIQDPDLAHVMSELITVDAMASVSLLASAGSRASNLLEAFKGHIMEPNGNFGSIMTNIRTLDSNNGPYRSWLRAIGVTQPFTSAPPDYSPSARRGKETMPTKTPHGESMTWDDSRGQWYYTDKATGKKNYWSNP